MRNLLKHIDNLPQLAREANWSAAALARKCGVSLRCLERAFRKELGTTVRAWLIEQRQHQAARLLHDDLSVKEVAQHLRYAYAHDFSRAFKQHSGHTPRAEATNPDAGPTLS